MKKTFVLSVVAVLLLVSASVGNVFAAKPLTTLIFDEVPSQPVDGLSVNGVIPTLFENVVSWSFDRLVEPHPIYAVYNHNWY